jgi:glycosyltransferase involved in cell wall biosynthesis
VTTEHNQPEVLTEPLHIPGVVRKPVNALLSAYFRNRQSKSDFVTMPTEQAIYNLLSKHELNIPVAAVSNGVDLSNFKPEKADENFIKECKLDKVSPTAVYVGRIDPEKKLELVIRAFREVLETMPEAKLVIAGDGVDRARLEKLVLDLGISDSVRFLGRVSGDKLYKVYNLGDVFVTASEIETQGIVLIEAVASGLPLVAVDKGAVSEVCLDGENGYLCKPGDVKEIAEAITKILSDKKLQEKFSKRSLEIAKEHDFEKTLDKFINIYNRVLDNNIK